MTLEPNLPPQESVSAITRIFVVALILLGAIRLAVAVIPLLEALMIAVLLAYLLDPGVQLLTRRTRLNRPLAAGLVYSLFLLLLTGIPAVMGTVALGQFRRWETDLAAAIVALREWVSRPIVILGFQLETGAILDTLEQLAGNALTTLPSGSFDVLTGVTTNLLWGLVILVSLYYLLKDGPALKPWLVGLAPAEYQPEFRRLVDEIDKVWGVFLRVQLLITVVLAFLMAAGTFLIIWLYRAGLLALSPWGLILVLILFYVAAQQVDNLWLRPQLMGKQLRLHPGLVFAGLVGALALSGVLGALIVVPFMATAKVAGGYIHRKLLDLDPWPQDEAKLEGVDTDPAGTQLTDASASEDADGRVIKMGGLTLLILVQAILVLAFLALGGHRTLARLVRFLKCKIARHFTEEPSCSDTV